ncbi:hypothetical protein [Alteriqipengyuania lutimaris]|uniref:Uncharacterized protein n=1 Tax=Alteriqipengyuania lutimaris TaxID=1538146 RepID=A0A395LJN1_9SPHN|nr:hypothetical protein [Alteriqipengyuania lutimaris]MBB3034069.1 hypothetical protein [Alteriqipengyuania lutimaris]RDS76991.1 hypothetical protein DL238_04795 [Alteriqipengyuania lutimaris]
MTRAPLISNHGSEIILLGALGVGVLVLLAVVAVREPEGWDVAACLLVLVRIVEAIQKRWEQRGTDLANARMHASKPDPEASAMHGLDQAEDR